jgi:3-deoxy-D-manno-octulosonate 8-phosphate phosphatase (KDO 8-P phosphatase)
MLYPQQAASHFKGRFFVEPEELAARLHRIRAFVFDWDGVFNGGEKDEHGSSPFNEVDAMGTNLLRFNHHLRNNAQAICAIITGENNKAAIGFAKREHFHSVYCGIKFKAVALEHLNKAYGILEGEVAFVFDDVLDFSVAASAGIRIMVNRDCNPLMIDWAREQGYIDYLTAADGANYALRESVELLTGLSGRYAETIAERAQFTARYQEYLRERNQTEPRFFTVKDSVITDL